MNKWHIISILLCMCGCTLANVNVEVVSERTALENQVLGSYNALDAQLLLSASVRGVDASGNISRPPAHSREYKDTLHAMQVIAFHQDDLDRFKGLGWVGENNQGLIEPFAMDRRHLTEAYRDFAERYTEKEFSAVISTINESREKIMMRVIYMNENLDEDDLPNVRKIFARIHRDSARPGDKIQDETGTWVTKQETP